MSIPAPAPPYQLEGPEAKLFVWTRTHPTKWRPAVAREDRWPGCRYNVGPGHLFCMRPATVEMNRGQTRRGRKADNWYGYCDEHAAKYGGTTRCGDEIWRWELKATAERTKP